MRDLDPFRFRNESSWVKLVAWLLLQLRLAIATVCLFVCVGALADSNPVIKRAVMALFSEPSR